MIELYTTRGRGKAFYYDSYNIFFMSRLHFILHERYYNNSTKTSILYSFLYVLDILPSIFL